MKVDKIKALGLNVDTYKINTSETREFEIDLKITAIIGAKEVFRNNSYTWYAQLNITNDNLFSNKNNFLNENSFSKKYKNKKINWGYSIDNSKTIKLITSYQIFQVPAQNIPIYSLNWKIPDIKCNIINICAWINKNDVKVYKSVKYLPLKEIYVKLLNYEVPINVKSNLNKVKGKIQNIIGNDDDQSSIFNMDYFSVRIDKFPNFNSKTEKDEDILYKKIRAAFLKLSKGSVSFVSYANKYTSSINIDGSWEFKPYELDNDEKFKSNQLKLWNENKGGTILLIEAGGGFLESTFAGDDGAVLESESNLDEKCWIFTTIITEESGSQPFSGHRQFGLHKDQDGFYRFYARAIDRIWPAYKLLLAGNSFEPLVEDYLTIANATWNNLIKNVSKFINDFGGKTTIMKPEIIVSDFKPFLDRYKLDSKIKKIGNINQFNEYEK